MTSVKLDNIIYSNLTEVYLNYLTTTGDINISGTITDGNTTNFSVAIPYTRAGTRADVYAKNGNTKMLANMGTRIPTGGVYSFVSTETASILIDYTSSAITTTISISNNTGSDITLNDQTITISVVQYDAPITAI